jgi:hypothetical protein
MSWQLPLVLLIVAAATGYLVRRAWRTWAGHGAGCSGCQCGDNAKETQGLQSERLIPLQQLTLRERRTR